jgi:ferredoxin-type protein NapG
MGATSRASAARRHFLQGIAGAAGSAAFAGLGLGLYARQTRAVPSQALRPPGALTEDQFQGACVRCGLCVRACPYNTLKLAALGDAVPTGTPYFEARKVPCEMCPDIPCAKACPSGALDRYIPHIDKARMGVAVLLDHESCLNHLGLRCDVCHRVCPLIDKAITLEARHNERTGKHAMFIPTVHSEHCTGCGKCERSCVLEEAAIKVLPVTEAKGALGRHYKLGWKEKEKAGRAIGPEVIELPVRKPEATP